MYRLEKTQLIVRLEACFLRSSLLTVSGGLDLNDYDNHLMNGLTTLVPLSPFQKKKKKSSSQLARFKMNHLFHLKGTQTSRSSTVSLPGS